MLGFQQSVFSRRNPSLLKKGAQSAEVEILQGELMWWIDTSTTTECGINNAKGCVSPASIDGSGKFGKATYETVRAFQGAQGLGVDGKVGPNTWTALTKYCCKTGYYAVTFSKDPTRSPNDVVLPLGRSCGAALAAPTPTLTKSGDDATRKGMPSLSGRKKFYQKPWFLPAVIGGGVLAVGLLFVFSSKQGQIITARPRLV